MRMRILLAAAAALALGGCNVTTYRAPAYGSPYGHGGYASPSYGRAAPDTPSLSNLDKGQRRALKQGCMERYGDHTRKYDQCVNGYRHSDDALVDGCTKRYAGDPRKIRRCMGL